MDSTMKAVDDSKTALRRLIEEQTRLQNPPLTPELRFWGADDYAEIWSATEDRLEALGLPPPFWAFAWPGGQALARHLLDHAEIAQGKRVLAIAAGAGLEAIAAAKSGAALVVANDIDAAAAEAALMNAVANQVDLETCTADLARAPENGVLDPRRADLVLLGDALYERGLSESFLRLLGDAAAQGASVLIAGPDRGFHPQSRADRPIETIARYRVPTRPELEDCDFRDVALMRLGV